MPPPLMQKAVAENALTSSIKRSGSMRGSSPSRRLMSSTRFGRSHHARCVVVMVTASRRCASARGGRRRRNGLRRAAGARHARALFGVDLPAAAQRLVQRYERIQRVAINLHAREFALVQRLFGIDHFEIRREADVVALQYLLARVAQKPHLLVE